MGSKWFTGGVVAASHGRIQFDFMFNGIRYRPSIQRPPSEANLRRARERLEDIKRQIEAGTFSFAEEFPDYRFLRRVICGPTIQLCGEVFDDSLTHCKSRYARGDLAFSTLSAYRRVLDGVRSPESGAWQAPVSSDQLFAACGDCGSKSMEQEDIQQCHQHPPRVFDFGYQDRPDQHNPTGSLRSARLKKKDRPKIDPFCMQDAESLIAAIHRDWGEAQGRYDEFRFFTGLRPSEEIALVLSDIDLVNGVISVNKARVAGVDRCQTKTGDDRRIALCPRALTVLKRQVALRARLEAAGTLQHDYVFFRETGEPFWNLQIQGKRWRATLSSLKLRYRRPYATRHSSPDGRTESIVGGQAARSQHRDNVARLCGVGGRRGGVRRGGDQALDEPNALACPP